MPSSGIYWIYQISRDLAVYVGSTANIVKRWREHRSVLKNGTAHNRYLQRVWNKYGEADFQFMELEACSSDRLIEREQFWVDAIDPICNMATCAENPTRGKPFSDDHRRKLSEAASKRERKPYSDEARANMSKAQKGHSVSQEQRQHISATLAGKKPSTETRAKLSEKMMGNQRAKNPSDETRRKISGAQKNRASASEETRRKLSEAATLAWARKRSQDKE